MTILTSRRTFSLEPWKEGECARVAWTARLGWAGMSRLLKASGVRPASFPRLCHCGPSRQATLPANLKRGTAREDATTRENIRGDRCGHRLSVVSGRRVDYCAGELIAEGVLAVEMAALASDLKLSIHPHPTLSETIMESAEVFFGQSTHLYRPKRH